VNGLRVLLVDREGLSPPISGALARAGHEVQVVTDAQAALESAEQDTVEVILCQADLPDMSGFELCRRLRGLPQTAHLPVLILAAEDDAAAAFAAGADDFCPRPSATEELLARVRAAWARRRASSGEGPAGLRGDLACLAVPELLQVLHLARSSGCLTVTEEREAVRCRLWLEQGEVAAVDLGGGPDERRCPEEQALAAVAAWHEGSFVFDSTVRAGGRVGGRGMRALLLEVSELLDRVEAGGTAADEAGASPALLPESRTVAGFPSATAAYAAVARQVGQVRDRLKAEAFDALVARRVTGRSAPPAVVGSEGPGAAAGEASTLPADPATPRLSPRWEALIDQAFAEIGE